MKEIHRIIFLFLNRTALFAGMWHLEVIAVQQHELGRMVSANEEVGVTDSILNIHLELIDSLK